MCGNGLTLPKVRCGLHFRLLEMNLKVLGMSCLVGVFVYLLALGNNVTYGGVLGVLLNSWRARLR